jgi:hypothetical protein
MPQRAVADLPSEHRPWDVPGHRVVAGLLIGGPMPLPTLARMADELGVRRESAYRTVDRLRKVGAIDPPTHVRGEPVRLASGERTRLRSALAAAENASTQVAALRAPSNEIRVHTSAGRIEHGNVLLSVHVEGDLMGAFAQALEQIAVANRSLWGAVTHGHGAAYILVADDRDGDVIALARTLEAAGARCERLQLSAPLDSQSLVAHARRIRNASVQEHPEIG